MPHRKLFKSVHPPKTFEKNRENVGTLIGPVDLSTVDPEVGDDAVAAEKLRIEVSGARDHCHGPC